MGEARRLRNPVAKLEISVIPSSPRFENKQEEISMASTAFLKNKAREKRHITKKLRKREPGWLDRSLVTSPVHYTLCLSQEDFDFVCREDLKIPHQKLDFVVKGNRGTTHFFHSGVSSSAIVCLDLTEKEHITEIYGLLVHEGVHVWQDIMNELGEDKPSSEFEAYSLQTIVQKLIEEYHRRVD